MGSKQEAHAMFSIWCTNSPFPYPSFFFLFFSFFSFNSKLLFCYIHFNFAILKSCEGFRGFRDVPHGIMWTPQPYASKSPNSLYANPFLDVPIKDYTYIYTYFFLSQTNHSYLNLLLFILVSTQNIFGSFFQT